jgi:hypothetical protein
MIIMIKSRMGWAGHVAHTGDEISSYKGLLSKLKERSH